ncbi:RelA/SpoT [Penicillium longicatenatum]|uniref:RelA/SpoT n=1 Tax=Penicillium longicatenatum TaxID=1561947 RepID=UPI0025477289|nr:RelA/SpoT [Penicillium longicatenatum]KAJ5643388.1 RelA/SpoT [Penicillium longicatenatum]
MILPHLSSFPTSGVFLFCVLNIHIIYFFHRVQPLSYRPAFLPLDLIKARPAAVSTPLENTSTNTPAEETIITRFVKQYDADFYTKLAATVADLCQQALLQEGVVHSVASRGKEPESLRKKLEEREPKRAHPYRTSQEIKDDIIDFAGVRIIIDHWADRGTVKNAIHKIFDGKTDSGNHIKERCHDHTLGYRADHYLVYLESSELPGHEDDLPGREMVEIQVQSTLLARWAESDHDSQYKPSRKPSDVQIIGLKAARRLVDVLEDNYPCLEDDMVLESGQAKSLISIPEVGRGELLSWIEYDIEAWAGSENRRSSCVLTEYMNSQYSRSDESLHKFLQDMIGNTSEVEYSAIANEYSAIRLDLVIYIMDCELVKKMDYNMPDLLSRTCQREHLDKIHVIMSTNIWMNGLFFPTRGWYRLFVSHEDRTILQKDFSSLARNTRQKYMEDFKDGYLLSGDKVGDLNALSGWFERRCERPIRLVFTISRQGVIKYMSLGSKELFSALELLIVALTAPV